MGLKSVVAFLFVKEVLEDCFLLILLPLQQKLVLYELGFVQGV